MPPDEHLFDEEDDWLHPEWIVCPSCQQSLFRIDTSPFDHERYLYCDRCPIRVGVSVYEPEFDQIEQALPPSLEDVEKNTALKKAIEDHLKPCTCGGTFHYDAPRRCFTCATPVIIEHAFGVDLFPNEDIFRSTLDPERQLKLDRWRDQFFPQQADKWQSPG